MLNYIWLGLIVLSVVMGGIQHQLKEVTEAAFDATRTAVVTLVVPLIGVMALWLGLMRLAEKSGLVQALARLLRPVLRWLFPEVPADHPAMGAMLMNFAANMLGLSNAATPMGLRAMKHLEALNPNPGTATNAMCTFLAINTSSIQLIPATTIGILAAAGSREPTAIVGTALIATTASTAVGIAAIKWLQTWRLFRCPAGPAPAPASPVTEPETAQETPAPGRGAAIPVFLILFTAFLGWVVASHFLSGNPAEAPAIRIVNVISLVAVPFLMLFLVMLALLKGVRVYEEFVEGAKEGFETAIRIIPYLVAMLVAIGMFRAAGGVDRITSALQPMLAWMNYPSELVPLSLMRPLSGSGANGIFAELVKTHGPDSLLARMAGTLIGSTETTFYVIAVYFGSVGVRRTRHALAAGLLADAAGMVAAVAVCRLVFT